LEALDFSQCPLLEVLNVRNNRLTYLNLKNVNIGNFNDLAAQNNPDLHCIEVSDPAAAEAAWRNNVDPGVRFSSDCSVVYIPDPNFKAAMLAYVDGNIDNVKDGEVQYEEAELLDYADVSGKNISDLTGLEAFIYLERFICSNNNISEIPVVNRINYLICNNNQISVMNGDYTYVQTLNVNHNRLTYLPYTLRNVNLLEANHNELTSIDLSNLEHLEQLYCSHNQLRSIYPVTGGYLTILKCNNNELTSLNISTASYIHDLDVSNNHLRGLILRNRSGNMTLEATGNPDLTCIEVDDPVYAEANWRDDVDPHASFSTTCPDPNVVHIPDPNFKAALLEQVDGSYDGYPDGEVQYNETEYIWYLDVSNRSIQDLTGLEAFTYLEHFDCSNNQVTFMPKTTAYYVVCSNNQITGFHSDNAYIQYLEADHNKLIELPNLDHADGIVVDYNELTSIDLKANPSLRMLTCSHNKLTSLKFNTYAIDYGFDARGNADLYCIEVDDPDYADGTLRDYVDPQASFSINCSSSTAARMETLSAYPNPTTGKVTIKSEQPVGEVQVFDMLSGGLKTIQHGNEIDLSHLKNGVYRMNINRGGNTSSVRIIKQ
jgi:Leucine-rich repeat (LRR) protein